MAETEQGKLMAPQDTQYLKRLRQHKLDRLEIFADEPSATKIQALRIVEFNETGRYVVRALMIALTFVAMKFSPDLVGWLTARL